MDIPVLTLGRSISDIRHYLVNDKKLYKPQLLRKCNLCNKTNLDFPQIFKLYQCEHSLCSICLSDIQRNYIYNLGTASCLVCKIKLSINDLINIIGAKELKKLDALIARKIACPTIKCLKCKKMFYLDAHDTSVINPDNENFLICPHCQENQCKSCRCVPFHKEQTCEIYLKERETM